MGEPGERHDHDLVSVPHIETSSIADEYGSDPREYLQHVMKATNMSCLTPEGALSGDCDFLSANIVNVTRFLSDINVGLPQFRSYIC